MGISVGVRCAGRSIVGAVATAVIWLVLVSVGSAQSGWQNTSEPLDVSNDGVIGINDYHIALNEFLLKRVSDANGSLPAVTTAPPFFDTSGDGFMTPIDLLLFPNQSGSVTPGIPANVTPVTGPASVSFDFFDLSGNAVSQVNVGDRFRVAAQVSDDRVQPLGALATYVDLLFDRSLATEQATTFPTDFQFALAGLSTATGIEEVGALPFTLQPTSASFELFQMEFEAAAPGTFSVNGANGYSLLVGEDVGVSPSFVGASLTIVPEPSGLMLVSCVLGFCVCLGRKHRRDSAAVR